MVNFVKKSYFTKQVDIKYSDFKFRIKKLTASYTSDRNILFNMLNIIYIYQYNSQDTHIKFTFTDD